MEPIGTRTLREPERNQSLQCQVQGTVPKTQTQHSGQNSLNVFVLAGSREVAGKAAAYSCCYLYSVNLQPANYLFASVFQEMRGDEILLMS